LLRNGSPAPLSPVVRLLGTQLFSRPFSFTHSRRASSLLPRRRQRSRRAGHPSRSQLYRFAPWSFQCPSQIVRRSIPSPIHTLSPSSATSPTALICRSPLH